MFQEFINVAGIKFRNAGRIYYYNTGDLELKVGDKVIVNTPIGLGLGEVIVAPTLVPKEKAHAYNVLERKMDNDYVLANLSPATLDGSIDSEPKVPEQLDMVIRKATSEDIRNKSENERQAEEAHECCYRLIKSKNLPMKLVRTEFSQNGKKVVFYFTSSNRVDFRDLVKELLKELKVRIELRQIDLRDETKMMGGIGCCGKTLCCSTFLRQFKPVSIKMAKEQNLALNPTKVSGVCGRLLCCLSYELDTYTEIKKSLPRIGSKVRTPDGDGKIIKVDIFSSKLDIILESGEMAHFEASQVKEIGFDRKAAVDTPDINTMISTGQTVSEEELKALEDDKVVDIKDTFMKPARDDNRQGRPQGQYNRGRDNRRDGRDRDQRRDPRDNRDRRDSRDDRSNREFRDNRGPRPEQPRTQQGQPQNRPQPDSHSQSQSHFKHQNKHNKNNPGKN